ncbi:hypothetical protein HanRHA438_Chr10g0440211 [Helianthus annuus]|nr:hypothetical protein HanRHA438_Chr10g0440211 [Helianthus annuus]
MRMRNKGDRYIDVTFVICFLNDMLRLVELWTYKCAEFTLKSIMSERLDMVWYLKLCVR